MQNIADDRYLQAPKLPLVMSNRQGIEERLGRMLVGSITGVDHRGAGNRRHPRRRAGGTVANDNRVRRHGLQVERRVDQRLPFDDT